MKIRSILSRLDELKVIVEGWQRSGEEPSSEVAAALASVKELYEMLRFPSAEVEVYVEPAPEPEPAPKVEPEPEPEPEVEVIEQDDVEDKRERMRKIRSLYVESEESLPEVEEPIQSSLTPPVVRLMDQLSFNDRILILNDLFGGDATAMDRALSQIDSQLSMDDALIYIAENFSWSADDEGSKILRSLLQQRFS